ncbi:ATP-binding cassette domain-containing protein [Trueperella abortisuis]|uniref:ATP-binding cassette domain-containing protein n=1 Tax=Trueperella abortisuis TaxID=445930 RepID=UPI002892E3CF|nr:ATP-binding cassette domain-containing protein [Trueperella abortisuis]
MGITDTIRIAGARTHNLRNISVQLPKHRLIGVAGVSGSGKSSLVSTLAAGAQQAVASLFPPFVQARMRNLDLGEVDRLEGLTFTAVVGQKKFSKNVRSSVATASGIAPYLRLLFSRSASPSAGYSPSYSANDPSGMCQGCAGLGYIDDVNLAELVDPHLSLNDGAIRFPSFEPGTYRWKRLVCSGISAVDVPWEQLPAGQRELLLYGKGVQLEHPLPGYPKHGEFDGVVPRLRASYLEKTGAKTTQREDEALRRIVRRVACSECGGQRINQAARESRLHGLNIAEAQELSIEKFASWLDGVRVETVAGPRQSIAERCKYLREIGLGYLSLDRRTDSLSGGEAQRLRIVELLGAPITDATFIMDEPSGGLHPADVNRLLRSLQRLRDEGNSVIVVEHNPQILKACDFVVELGPGSGADGGTVMFTGNPQQLATADTPTGRALRIGVQLNNAPRAPHGSIRVEHARLHNLRDVSVDFPLGVLTVVSGVAGSGKSSLVEVLAEQHPEVAMIDQAPLAANSRSSLLTALELADTVRGVFAAASGLNPSWFSANGKGACQACKGRGAIRVDMAFMDDVETVCEQCGGRKFNDIALSVTLPSGSKQRSIADVLGVRLDEVDELFAAQPKVLQVTELLRNVGLGYVTLGQTLDTLSGGELQRVKLVRFLKEHRQDAGGVLVLDEPTTGLHPHDVAKLAAFLHKLTTDGLTVIVVDHNLHLIAQADHNIDIGPGAGEYGGTLIYQGSPQGLIQCSASRTGEWLRL